MIRTDAPVWRKSSYSGGAGDNCVEVADNVPGAVPVRDSKTPGGPALSFADPAWAAFIGMVKHDG
ncbi:DUF397 domain-containing protein [Streptomyces sp. NPDC006798]|uniref:DUF397 domain-containing protein n=1 Tax=Streptomyces sp. NPDC006798 TaxID=3155462 RepID=UPI0033EA43B5